MFKIQGYHKIFGKCCFPHFSTLILLTNEQSRRLKNVGKFVMYCSARMRNTHFWSKDIWHLFGNRLFLVSGAVFTRCGSTYFAVSIPRCFEVWIFSGSYNRKLEQTMLPSDAVSPAVLRRHVTAHNNASSFSLQTQWACVMTNTCALWTGSGGVWKVLSDHSAYCKLVLILWKLLNFPTLYMLKSFLDRLREVIHGL